MVLRSISGVSSDATIALFSESNSRFVISIKAEDQAALEALFEELPLQLIGEVVDGNALTLRDWPHSSAKRCAAPLKPRQGVNECVR